MSTSTTHDPKSARPARWDDYVLPMVAFVAFTSFEGQLPAGPSGGPHPLWYPLAYAIKLAIVVGLAWRGRRAWADLRPWPGPGLIAAAIAIGLAVALAWVALDGLYPSTPWLGTRAAFNPAKLPIAAQIAFYALRAIGLVAVVPLVEELFWRSFLMRWIIDPDFQRVPIGRISPLAVAVTAGLFALEHPEWLPALLAGLAWAGLLAASRSLTPCVISHAVANAALGAYVVVTGDWKFL